MADASRSARWIARTKACAGRTSGSASPPSSGSASTASSVRARIDGTSAPTFWSTGTTSPSSWSSSARSRWAGATSGLRRSAASRCAAATASWDFTVNRSGCMSVGLSSAPDGDLDRPRLIGGHEIEPVVRPVGDELRLQRAAHTLDLLAHLLLQLLGALAHALELGTHPRNLLLHLQDRLHPGAVQPLIGGHPLDATQPLDIALGVQASLLGGALGPDEPPRLVHAQGLGMHLGELGGHGDHEHAALGVDGALDPVGDAAPAPGVVLIGHRPSSSGCPMNWIRRSAPDREGCGRSWSSRTPREPAAARC